MKAAFLRIVRILVAQGISYVVLTYGGINIPILNISVGALINAIAKYLRDKYDWNWLPV